MNNRSHLLIITAMAMIALIFVWQNSNKISIRNLDSSGTNIVALGDSLIYGVGSTPGNDFISLLSARLGRPIINLGRSGDTTAAGLERLDEVFRHDPKIVIILLGGNDYLRRVPADQTFANLAVIIETIQQRGAAVLLLGVRGGLLSDGYEKRFEDLAEEYETGHVPNVLANILGKNEFMSDQIHPNDDGYRRIADKIEPLLRQMLE